MSEHMEAAIEAGKLALCKHYNEWEEGQIVWESPTDIQEEINEFEDATRSAIIAALPHIRAMIAEETANSWIPHRDELAQAIASGYEPDHPVPNRHDYKATDSVLRLLTAARNAEGIQA